MTVIHLETRIVLVRWIVGLVRSFSDETDQKFVETELVDLATLSQARLRVNSL